MGELWEYGEAAGGDAVDRTAGPASAEPHPSTSMGGRAFPWPPPEEGGVLTAFGETWKSATFDPARFFARTPRDGGAGAAVLYYLVIGVLVSGVGLFWNQLFWRALADGVVSTDPTSPLDPLTGFLFSPLVLLLMLGVSAGLVHVLLLLFGGARHGFGTTVRVFCYSYSPMLFAIVPFLGGLVGGIWTVVLAIIGLREAHEADGWQAVLAVLLPFVAIIGLGMLLVLAILAAGIGLMV